MVPLDPKRPADNSQRLLDRLWVRLSLAALGFFIWCKIGIDWLYAHEMMGSWAAGAFSAATAGVGSAMFNYAANPGKPGGGKP